MGPTNPTLDPLRRRARDLAPPIVLFNKSHSGSRVLAELVEAGGIFLGAHRNDSFDSLDAWTWLEAMVGRFYPDYSPLWDASRPADPELAALGVAWLERHLQGFSRAASGPWGWKLCESGYLLPVIDFCFPGARYVHLLRDGRDVAFSDHRGPSDALWRKIYFDSDRVRTFRGRRLTSPAYRRESHLWNAVHWVNAVRVGRTYGMMLRERYLEVRYEDLCRRFEATARRVLAFVGAPDPERALRAVGGKVSASAIGKHRRESRARLRTVVEIEKPLLLSLGYLRDDPEPVRPWRWPAQAAADGLDRLRKRSPARRGAR